MLYMNEARKILMQIFTSTVANAAKEYHDRSVSGKKSEKDHLNGSSKNIITAWYDPEEYNHFEMVGRYEVSGTSLFSTSDPCVVIRSRGIDEYSFQIPCSYNKCKSKIIFSKNIKLYYSGKVEKGSDKAYVLYEEDVLKSEECRQFLLQFMSDTFPDKENELNELFGYSILKLYLR